jgi:hypothetical protein
MSAITAGRFAAATSVLALVVAMGGTGYAAVKIGGKQIKNNAITSKKIKDNSVTGADVDEGSLAKVPSAASADSAATAGKVNGVTPTKVFFRSATGAPIVIFNGGGLVISAGCPATNDLTITASTTKNDASIFSSFDDVELDSILGNDDETQGFDIGDNYDLMLGDTSGTQDPALLTFVYDAPDGSVVTGNLATDNSDGGADVCSLTGTILAG